MTEHPWGETRHLTVAPTTSNSAITAAAKSTSPSGNKNRPMAARYTNRALLFRAQPPQPTERCADGEAMAQPRPPFHVLWAASQRIYDAKNSSAKVAKVIGGKVAVNINAPQDPWVNTCAVRISYILNAGGVPIPHLKGKTVSGANGKWHFYLVKEVIAYLTQIWGPADMQTAYPPPGGGPLAGKQGAILFEVKGWNDAVGHASLWNGKTCYDHCYFNEPQSTYTCTNAHFWELP